MEYLRLTNGKTTVIVIDQDNPDHAAWAYAIKYKSGKENFKAHDSRTNLESAVREAVEFFRGSLHGFQGYSE